MVVAGFLIPARAGFSRNSSAKRSALPNFQQRAFRWQATEEGFLLLGRGEALPAEKL